MFFIAVDFDGTIVEHEFPEIGAPVRWAFYWLQEWQKLGAKLILWTCRSDSKESGPVLSQAVEFCTKNGIEFFGVNENLMQSQWTSSPKMYANVYVDDAGEGIPLRQSTKSGNRPVVDWDIVGPKVLEKIINHKRKGSL